MLDSTQVKAVDKMKAAKNWWCDPSKEVDSSIRRYRARFCKASDLATSKLTHSPASVRLAHGLLIDLFTRGLQMIFRLDHRQT
jgi:hypothetical protein